MAMHLEARHRAVATTRPVRQSACGEPPPCAAPSLRAHALPRPTWADLKSAIRANGRFDRALIVRIALARARAERDAFDRMGLPQPWTTLLAHELRLSWQVAKTAMDGLIAERIRARLAPAERAARTIELRAEILASAIPPRQADAAGLRAQAAEARHDGDGRHRETGSEPE